jgi:tetratricopeptide (TPR) repeat protein
MMKRLTLLFCLLIAITCNDLFSQSKTELKNNFYDAESWMLFEAYKDALPIYLQLLNNNPYNSNFKYRIGQCYLNTPGDKEKAVIYLEEAVKNINPNYKEGRFKESGAPYDALYYLANAYRINNQLDKALETYDRFRKELNPEVYDTAVVNQQMQSCRNAKELMGRPKFIRMNNLGNVINEGSSEFNPVVSDDENMIVFSKSEAFYDAILYSVKNNGNWSVPKNMNEILQVDRDLFPTSLSSDGKTLYLYSSADYDGIIYSSRFENGTWSPLVELNENINTKYWESHATVSHDNNKLYFTSNRKGTFGGLDIYVSRRDSTGDWGPAVNLGPVINTKNNEESPFLSQDDKTLYFSSRGHFNMGGYDIFTSKMLKNGEWSEPVNEGYPLNTTDDDVFFKPAVEKYKGYYSIRSSDGYGKEDIYKIEIFSDDHPRKFIISGISSVADLNRVYSDSVKISILNTRKSVHPMIVYTNPATQEYKFDLPQGDYKLNYEGYGGEKVTRDLNLPLNSPTDNFVLPETVLPRTDHTADIHVEGSNNISVTKADSILLTLKVEPQSMLAIENWSGNSIVTSEKHPVTSPDFNYRIAPRPGDNRVVFKLTDRFSNIATADVFIKREKELITEPVAHPEYTKIFSNKQIAAYLAMLENRADENQLKLITGSGAETQEFRKPDDLLSYLKTKASNANLKPETFDKLALRVAVMDNILTQAAVDLLANYSEGEVKNIITGLDIYKADLKTWSELQKYVSERSSGKITPQNLDNLAAFILTEVDPSIAIIRDKILAFSETDKNGAHLRESVAVTDKADARVRGNWLKLFCEESSRHGFTTEQLSQMFVIISTLPETKTDQFLNDLIVNSEEPLISSLKSMDLKKADIKSPDELVLLLITSSDKIKYPEETVFKSIANLIVSKNIPAETIKAHVPPQPGNMLWILLIIIGAGIIFFFIIFRRRRNKGNKEIK